MKWVEITRDGPERSFGSVAVAAAILVMEMEEVFVARMAWDGAIWTSLEKMEVLRSAISGTASITKSTLEKSSSFVVGVSIERILEAASWVRRSLETSLARSLSANGGLRS